MKPIIDTVTNKDALLLTSAKASMSQIITRKELCKRLDISEATAIRYEKAGKLPAFRLGKNVRHDWIYVLSCLIEDSNASA